MPPPHAGPIVAPELWKANAALHSTGSHAPGTPPRVVTLHEDQSRRRESESSHIFEVGGQPGRTTCPPAWLPVHLLRLRPNPDSGPQMRRAWICFTLAGILTSYTLAGQAISQPRRPDIASANQLFQSGKFAEAGRIYSRLAARDPKDYRV